MSNDEEFAWSELPAVVANYLKAHVVQDYATAVTFLADDVTVLDDGHTLEGRQEILKLFNASADQAEVTTTLHTISTPADGTWESGTHLSGNFPGGEVDLRMIFTVHEGTIRKLKIAV